MESGRRVKEAENASWSRFSDVSDGAWYADAVAWANANGIVTGYSAAADGKQRFGPDDSITREQLSAVILYRYAKYKGIDTTQGGMAAREYDDFESVSSYAAEAVDWAVNAKLISGVNTTTLAPKGNATRAQTSAILETSYRDGVSGLQQACELIYKIKSSKVNS